MTAAERPAQSIGDWSWRALSAEVNAAGWKARAKAAESALTDLRGRIEALVRDLDAARASGTIYTYGQVQDRLRALLAGSGERPGEGLTLPGGLPPSPYYRPAPSTTTEGGS